MLQINNLSVSYDSVQAVNQISFTAQKGRITTVIGANGAGKTTLLRTISGLIAPKSGTISWSGREIQGMRPENIVRAGIAQAPEGHSVIAELTVEENIRMGALFRLRTNRADVRAAISESYELFPRLEERKSQKAGTLSGGERQMLAISRALVSRPE
ncbi:MAG: ATP-binding cassette domain-containing protein, partial [Actinobacteria bacterium]|nr:ATP-binding cassette domain-containing protein [Actinomycetota bacterium]